MREFDNRVLFQMSAADSSNLIDSPAANQLGLYRALLHSEEQGLLEKFRPYAMLQSDWLEYVETRLRTHVSPPPGTRRPSDQIPNDEIRMTKETRRDGWPTALAVGERTRNRVDVPTANSCCAAKRCFAEQ